MIPLKGSKSEPNSLSFEYFIIPCMKLKKTPKGDLVSPKIIPKHFLTNFEKVHKTTFFNLKLVNKNTLSGGQSSIKNLKIVPMQVLTKSASLKLSSSQLI